MNRDVIRQIAVIVGLISTLIVNGLANALPINGQTTGDISNRLQILFVPENYVFGIWGVIYTFLIIYTVYQALPSQKENPILRRIGWLFVLSCFGNITWLLAFHYNQFLLSMPLMLVVLFSLIGIYIRAGIGTLAVNSKDKWIIHIPFSIYLAWITVATIANATYVLYDANWDGFGIAQDIWAVVMLIVATGVVSALVLRTRDIAYTAVIVWAFIGIVIKQQAYPNVAITAGLMTVVVIAVLIASRTVLGQWKAMPPQSLQQATQAS